VIELANRGDEHHSFRLHFQVCSEMPGINTTTFLPLVWQLA